jgi:hypothetical protein
MIFLDFVAATIVVVVLALVAGTPTVVVVFSDGN